MHRFFTDEWGIENGFACLEEADGRHAARVLRLEAGDEIVLLDGKSAWRGKIVQTDGDAVKAAALEKLPSTEPRLLITLYQGLPKADKMDWIVQKGTEIGISAFVPVQMERSIVRLNPRDSEKKRDRWRKIAREASKQAGRCHVPQVFAPLSFAAAVEMAAGRGQALVPWEEAKGVGIAAAREGNACMEVSVWIGPEGGVTREEIEALKKAARAIPVTLGPRILRTETAGLAAACALLTLSGDMA